MMLHRDTLSWRRHKTTKLKAIFRSANASAKQLIYYHLSSNKSTRSRPEPVVSAVSPAPCVELTHEPSPRAPESTLTATPTFASDATTIRPAVATRLNPERHYMRDSGVVIPPDDFSTHSNAELALDVNEMSRPVPKPRCVAAVPLDPPARIDTKASAVAVQSPGRHKSASRPRTWLYSLMLQVIMDREMESLAMTIASRDRFDDNYWGAKGYLYCLDIPAVICMLLPSFGVNLATGYCDKFFGICGLLAKAPPLKYTILSVPLDFPPSLLDKDVPHPSPLGYSDITNPVDSVAGRERAPSHSNTAPSTHQKRKQTNPHPSRVEKRRHPADGRKAGKDKPDDEEGNGGDERKPNPRHLSDSFPSDGSRLFACPYYKDDPVTHRFCLFRQSLTGTNYVKQHLRRYHKQPIHCPTCGMVFKKQSMQEAHIRDRTCRLQEFSHPGMTQAQLEALGRSPRVVSCEERWFMIWDIVLDGKARPESPYVEDPFVEVMKVETALWAEKGGPGRMESMGITLSRAGQAGGLGQGSASEGPEAWYAVLRDMIDFSARLVNNSRPEPETHVAGQQQVQSQPATVSSLDMVPAPNRESSQGQAVASRMPPPARGTRLLSEYSPPRATYNDQRVYGMPTNSGSGYGSLYSAGGGAHWGTQPAPTQEWMPGQPAMAPTFQSPHVWPAMSVAPLFDEFQGLVSGYDASAVVDAALQEQAMGHGMRQAPPMGREPSRFFTPEQALLGRGIDMAGGDAVGPGGQGQAGMPGGHGQQVWTQGGQEQDDENFQSFYNLNSDLRENEYDGGA